MTSFIGIDLAGPANPTDTAACILRCTKKGRHPRSANLVSPLTDEGISALARAEPEASFALDAPLSYQPGGGSRDSDRALRAALKDEGLGGTVSVMCPTLTRMAYLTMRGIVVARTLEHHGIDRRRISEVHPGASLLLSGVTPKDVAEIRSSKRARQRVASDLSAGLKISVPHEFVASDHALMALASAAALWRADVLATHRWEHAAQEPEHPYRFLA